MNSISSKTLPRGGFLLALYFTCSFTLNARANEEPIALPISISTFTQTLNDINLKVAPQVKQSFGERKVFRATGDWHKEYSESSAGGSYYHPEISGVEWADSWGVHIVGWLARLPGFDTDTITFILCHELGHHVFGGEAEVAADHFAAKCLRWTWSAVANSKWLVAKVNQLSVATKTTCANVTTSGEREFCLRTITAYGATESFRTDIWKKRKILTDSEIKSANICRRSAVLNGIVGQPSPECQF